MGCGACRLIFEENFDSPLDSILKEIPSTKHLNFIQFERLNKLYKKASFTIDMIEQMRETLIDKLDELILNTGACVFSSPDITTCLRCILWKLSASSQGNLKSLNVKLVEEEPFLQFSNHNNINKKFQGIIDSFINYISDVNSLKTQIKEIDQNIPELVYIITENNENYIYDHLGEENAFNLDPSDKTNLEVFHILRVNNNKIKKAIDLFPDLVRLQTLTFNKFRYEISLFKSNVEYISNIDKIGLDASKRNIEDIFEISFYSKSIINKKSEENIIEFEEKSDGKVYMKSITEGKSKYMSIIQNKKFLKEKKKKNKF